MLLQKIKYPMKTTILIILLSLALLSWALSYSTPAHRQTLDWSRQLGTSTYDASHGVSADCQGHVYISGCTYGNLEGDNAGDLDAFLVKISDHP